MIGPTACVEGVPKREGIPPVGVVAPEPGGGVREKSPEYVEGGWFPEPGVVGGPPLPGGRDPGGTASGVPAMITCQSSQLHIGSFQRRRTVWGRLVASSLSEVGRRPNFR